jgi:hypothetical protein
VIVYVKFSSVGAGTVWGGGGLPFILGLNLGGWRNRTGEGSSGGGKKGVV